MFGLRVFRQSWRVVFPGLSLEQSLTVEGAAVPVNMMFCCAETPIAVASARQAVSSFFFIGTSFLIKK